MLSFQSQILFLLKQITEDVFDDFMLEQKLINNQFSWNLKIKRNSNT